MEKDKEFTPILCIKKCKILTNKEDEIKLLEKGDLFYIYIPSSSTYLITLNNFRYSITKEIPIMRQKTNFHYILPSSEPTTNFAILLPVEASFELVKTLDSLLMEHAEFSYLEIEPKLLTAGDIYAPKQGFKEGKGGLVGMITGGGKAVKNTLKLGADTVVVAVQKGGAVLKGSLIKPNKQPLYICKEAKDSVGFIHDQTYLALGLSQEILGGIIETGGTIGKLVKGKMGGRGAGEMGEKIGGVKQVAEVVDAGMETVNSIYDQMFESMFIVGEAVKVMGVDLVEYKYGEDAGALTGEMIDTGIIGAKVYKTGTDASLKGLGKGAVTEALHQIAKEDKGPSPYS